MIKVKHLYFDYPGTRALDDVSFELAEGSIVALVGPNGAGKSTLLRNLAALDQPLAGEIWLDGEEIRGHARQVHQKLGYLSDFFGLYDELTVEQCLTFHAGTHGIKTELIADCVHKAAQRLGLIDRLHQKAKELSRGLRQRLAIAQAIVHEPKVLLLDEPASGLDPEARHQLATLFCLLRDQGMTLLVSSHILTELEEYSTHMLMLRHGKIIAQESIGHASSDLCEIQLTVIEHDDALAEVLAAYGAVTDIKMHENIIYFTFSRVLKEQQLLLKYLIEQGVMVVAFAESESDMHKEYLSIVEEQDAVSVVKGL